MAKQLAKELRNPRHNIEYYAGTSLRFEKKWVPEKQWSKAGVLLRPAPDRR